MKKTILLCILFIIYLYLWDSNSNDMSQPVDLEELRNKLIHAIDISKKKLDAVNLLLNEEPSAKRDLFSQNDISSLNGKSKVTSFLGDQFPAKGMGGAQIMFLFNNILQKGSKISDIEKVYNNCIAETNGSPKRVDNATRKLLQEGKLVMVKYNGYNRESYYGLPSWIDGEDYKDERKPENDYLEIESTDITSHIK